MATNVHHILVLSLALHPLACGPDGGSTERGRGGSGSTTGGPHALVAAVLVAAALVVVR